MRNKNLQAAATALLVVYLFFCSNSWAQKLTESNVKFLSLAGLENDPPMGSQIIWAEDYQYRYVRSDGANEIVPGTPNDCLSADTPCATIQHALDQSQGFDTIRISTGEYQENLRIHDQGTYNIEGGWNQDFSTRLENPNLTQIDGFCLDNVLSIDVQSETIEVMLSAITLKNGKILDGLAQGTGSAISVESWQQSDFSLQIDNCILTGNNHAIGIGSDAESNASLTIKDSIIKNNSGGVNGAGLTLYSSSGTATIDIRNTIFAANSCTQRGGALAVVNTDGILGFSMVNTSIYGNQTELGGGIFFLSMGGSEVSAILINTIIWGNSATNDPGDDICLNSSDPASDSIQISAIYSDIGAVHDPQNLFTYGVGNINQDPLLLDPENSDFHLTVKSPAVDSGICGFLNPYTYQYIQIAPTEDLSGRKRPVGQGCDMGAYEYAPQSMPSLLLLLLG